MHYNPSIHHRRSIRLRGYDYTQPNFYFITVCVQQRAALFGTISNGHLLLNDAGRMIEDWYKALGNKFPQLQTDAFICMPNHIHMLLHLLDQNAEAEARLLSISEVIQWFKTMTTNAYIRGVKQSDWSPFQGRLWQRNYWEHIVRDEKSLESIRDYIINNPKTWENDHLNNTNT